MAKKIPLRQCVGCGEMRSKKEMLRVLKSAEDDTFCLDITGKKNGRGAYICHSQECLLKAIKTKAIERSLSCKIDEDVYERLKEEIL